MSDYYIYIGFWYCLEIDSLTKELRRDSRHRELVQLPLHILNHIIVTCLSLELICQPNSSCVGGCSPVFPQSRHRSLSSYESAHPLYHGAPFRPCRQIPRFRSRFHCLDVSIRFLYRSSSSCEVEGETTYSSLSTPLPFRAYPPLPDHPLELASLLPLVPVFLLFPAALPP